MATQSGSASYYTRDSLKNFYVRVELRKLTSSGALGTAFLRESAVHPLSASRASTIGGQDAEVWMFRWQEKVFSQHEEEVFADANNCSSTVEEQYHRDILTLRNEGGRPNRRLFCYIDSDHFQVPVEEIGESMVVGGAELETFAHRNASSIRRRHVTRTNQSVPGSAVRDPVSSRPSESERLSHRLVGPHSQSMFIMADLRKMDSRDTADEHVLCKITVDGNGVVTFDPDLNSGRPAYRIENRHREVFEYHIEHASEVISPEEKLTEKKVLSELYSRRVTFLNACVGNTFSDPPEDDALRVLVLGEIVSAKGFEYDDLYVTLHLELPDFWTLECEEEDDMMLKPMKDPTVTTQISRTKSIHLYNVAHFGCPFEFDLVYHNPEPTQETLARWPRLIVEVSSLDYWDRHRAEGYGHIDLPPIPGFHDVCVQTWRPAGRRILDKMRRFFVGGAPQIDDVSYVATPKNFQGSHLSKYGFRTESSGSVNIRMNIAHHSSHLIKKKKELPALSFKRRGSQDDAPVPKDSFHGLVAQAVQQAKAKTSRLTDKT